MKKTFLLIFFMSLVVSLCAQEAVIEYKNVFTPGALTVTTTTSSIGGNYSPRNIVSIWIQDDSGEFLKTLLIYADKQIQYLTNWIDSSASNKVDAFTGATQSTHGSRFCSWDATNLDTPRRVVTDGTYTVRMELTEGNGTGKTGSFTFIKGPAEQTITPADIQGFTNISIKWTPTLTGINEAKLSDLYSVYPNSSKGQLNIKATKKIDDIQIINCIGQTIKMINTNSLTSYNLNLEGMSEGVYILRVKMGSFVQNKKIVIKK